MDPVEKLFRTVLPTPGTHKGTSSCQAKRCPKSTREGKPFCSTHIEQSPYINHVMGELKKRESEIELLKKRRTLPKNAHLIRETLLLLRMNPYTAKGLARRLDISHDAADALINQICFRKLAVKKKTPRGEKRICGLIPPKIRIDEK
jgi:hypothetical protein